MKQIKIYNDYNSKFLFNATSIKSLILNVLEEKQIKLVDYGMKFLNYEKINNYMSPELFKNHINKK